MQTKINTLAIEAALAEKYKYRPLSKELSEKYRQFFLDNMPDFLSVHGDNIALKTSKGSIITNGYDRIVIGDYGAFIEFNESQANHQDYFVPQKQMFRINNPSFVHKVKYEWWSIVDGSDIKIYKQKRGVKYADYTPGKYYVSVHEVTV